jgi:hypothetical protein
MIGVDVVVQRVRTLWTRRSRGFPAAVARHAVPVAFELPSGRGPLFHDVAVREWDGFVPEETVVGVAPSRREVSLRAAGDTLLVRVPDGFGVPVRAFRPTVTLRRGEWLRWQLNNRSSSSAGMADWHYTLTTVNVAFGPIAIDGFLGEPARLVDELAGLR